MGQSIRATLSGYDALTDSDPDGFSLYADSDWILVKEKDRDSGSVSFGNSDTISHSLGYIPAYMVWGEIASGRYRLVNSGDPIGGGWSSYSTTSNLVIENSYSSTYTDYRYYIFYDDMSVSGTPSITESDVAIKVTKAGKDALTSTNPNDYIFHSDLNTFKILAEGNLTSKTVSGNPSTFTFSHGEGTALSVYGFAKFPDGYVAAPLSKSRASSNPAERYWVIEVDSTNISFKFWKGSSSNYDVDIKYYVFETPAS